MYIINIILICIFLLYIIYIYFNIYNINDILKKLPDNYFQNLLYKPSPIFDYSEINLDALLKDIDTLKQKIDIENQKTINLRNLTELKNKEINIQKDNISKLHDEIDKLRYDILSN